MPIGLIEGLQLGFGRATDETARVDLDVAIARIGVRDPRLEVATPQFAAHLGRCWRDVGTKSLLDLHVEDLGLAHACARAVPHAIRRLEQDYGGDLERVAAMQHTLPPREIVQRVLLRTCLADAGRAPRILGYRGRAPLRGWLRVIASRLVVDATRRGDLEVEVPFDPDSLRELAATATDLDLQLQRWRYRDDLAQAVQRALQEMTAADRRLLRHRFVDKLSSDAIGAMLGVDRTTAARRIERIRRRLEAHVGAELRERWRAGEATVASIVGHVRGELDLSVGRLLASS